MAQVELNGYPVFLYSLSLGCGLAIFMVLLTIWSRSGDSLKSILTLTAWKYAQLLAENADLGTTRETLSDGLISFPYESQILYYKKNARGIVDVRTFCSIA